MHTRHIQRHWFRSMCASFARLFRECQRSNVANTLPDWLYNVCHSFYLVRSNPYYINCVNNHCTHSVSCFSCPCVRGQGRANAKSSMFVKESQNQCSNFIKSDSEDFQVLSKNLQSHGYVCEDLEEGNMLADAHCGSQEGQGEGLQRQGCCVVKTVQQEIVKVASYDRI